MINIDSLNEIKKADPSNILGSIMSLPDQMTQAWDEFSATQVPEACKLSKNVVVSGMGGSALGGRIVDSLITEKARAPIEIFTEFRLPNYVNADTFVILSSYSGNTEETLTAGREALNRGASIFCISTGGKLAEFMRQNNLEGYIIDPKFNPSNQPRMGLGYSIISVLGALAQCQFINLLGSEVHEAIDTAKEMRDKFKVEIPEAQNPSKSLARKFVGKIPVLIASEHLVGVTHAFKNQLNENAKTFALLFDIPELNHHLLEGLGNPIEAKKLLYFLFIESDLYTKQVIDRYGVTKDVVEQNGIETGVYKLQSPRKLTQIFEELMFGSFINYYLAMLYGINPAPIPWVDYFKKKL